ncbi:unnamed protein product [Rhodiola kirilowii]
MLSYENNPPDLLKSVGKSINSSHENITGDHNSLPEVEHQLISSSSVQVHDEFSIRDFVLSARNKDIRTNWPFSDKHLKLCLMHGVKDVLPPFQPKTSKRKQFSTICLDKNSLGDDGNIARIPDKNASARVNSPIVCSLGDVVLTQKATANRLEVNLDQPDKDGGFALSDTSYSQAYPSISGSTFKHHKFPKTVAKTSANKCKLVVKFVSPSFHSLNEEIMPHKTNLSDSPAFKVCPVCKTFSSSSNTTLNAHIDQCLSMETTSEGMADSKIFTKCKVKPRKMRSMANIYTTALVCTIEDLDRRNGSRWATDLSLPAQNICVNSSQGNKKQRNSFTEPDIDANGDSDDGGVYIDANGRKLRRLSKMDSFSSVVTTKEDGGSRRTQTRKILSGDQKNHHKYLKPAVSNKKFLATTANSSEVSQSQRPSNDSLLSEHKSHSQIINSRDTDELEKFRDNGTHQHPGRKLRSVQRSTAKNQKSRLGTSSPEFYRDSTSLNESRKRMKSSDYIHISKKRFLGAKETGLSMSKEDTKYEMDRNGHKRLKKSTECIIGKHSTWKPLKQFNRSEEEIVDNRPSHPKCAGSTKHVHQFLQKSSKVCKDDTSSLGIQALCSTNEEDQMQVQVEEEEDDEDEDEHVATWQSESRVIRATIPENTKNQTIESSVNESEQERRAVSQSSKDGALNMSANSCDELFDNLDGSLSSSKVAKTNILTDTHMNFTAERTMRSFIRSVNPDIHDRADSYYYQSSPQTSKGPSTEPNSKPCPPDQVLSNEVSNYTIKELEPNATQGNACSDTGPIPIPDPPGSFLPSPGNGRIGDYQGNESLTVSLSSHEQQGGNSLESPNSTVSLTSNLAAETSEKAAETFSSTGTHVIPDSSLSDFPIPISEVSIVEAPLFPQALKVGARRSEFSDQKNYVRLEDNNQPCCCSRRERVHQGNVVDYQVSQILRRRAMPAVVLPAKENISGSLNTEPNDSCAGSDIYSLGSSSSFRVEAIPVFKRLSGFASPKNSDTIHASNFHTNVDSESASPSAVLRLMGKNLMVAKNDEDYSDLLGDAAASDTNTQRLSRKTASPCKPPNQSYCSQSHSAVPPDPAINSPSYRNMRHTFEFRMPNGPWGQMTFPRPDETNHSQASVTRMHDMHMNSGGPAIDHKWQVQQCLPKNGFDVLHHEMYRGTSLSIDFRKPIDPGSDVSALKNGITVTNCLNGTGAPVAAEPDQPRLIYPVYRGFRQALPSMPIYLQQGSRNTCFPVPFSSGRSLNPQVKYLRNDSYVLHGHGMVSSPSTHLKPRLFYTPRLP